MACSAAPFVVLALICSIDSAYTSALVQPALLPISPGICLGYFVDTHPDHALPTCYNSFRSYWVYAPFIV